MTGLRHPIAAAPLRHTQSHPGTGIGRLGGNEPLQQLQRHSGLPSVTEAHAKVEERRRIVGVALQREAQGGDTLLRVAPFQEVRPLLSQRLRLAGFLPADDHPVMGDGHFGRSALADELLRQVFADRLEVGVALKPALILGQLWMRLSDMEAKVVRNPQMPCE